MRVLAIAVGAALLAASSCCRTTAPPANQVIVVVARGGYPVPNPTAPGPVQSPTLLVTNATCAPGPCVPFQVRAVIADWRGAAPQPPAGALLIGSVTTAVTCLQFRGSEIVIIGDSAGIVADTARAPWGPLAFIALTAATSDSTPLGFGSAVFVPAASPGWSVTLPNTESAPEVLSAPRCTP